MGGGSLNTAGHGAGTTITAVHLDILRTHIWTRLDGPTLASACCASSQLHALSTEENLWREICNHTWPSTADPRLHCLISCFPAGHRSFYSHSFPAFDHRLRLGPNCRQLPPPAYIISAVDIHYQNRLIVSKVQETETGSDILYPFWIDLLGRKETVPLSVKLDIRDDMCLSDLEENLTLSWILIDPSRKQARNISSRRPVSVKRNWLTNDVELRYVTVLAGEKRGQLVKCVVMVTCGAKEGGGGLKVIDVGLHVKDMEGRKLRWLILQEALEGTGKRRIGKRGEERERYVEWLRMARQWRERGERERRREKMRRKLMFMASITALIFSSIWCYVEINFLQLLR